MTLPETTLVLGVAFIVIGVILMLAGELTHPVRLTTAPQRSQVLTKLGRGVLSIGITFILIAVGLFFYGEYLGMPVLSRLK